MLGAKSTALMPRGHPHISLFCRVFAGEDPPVFQRSSPLCVLPTWSSTTLFKLSQWAAVNAITQCHKSHILTPGAEWTAGADELLWNKDLVKQTASSFSMEKAETKPAGRKFSFSIKLKEDVHDSPSSVMLLFQRQTRGNMWTHAQLLKGCRED